MLSGPAFDARLDEGLEFMDDASRPASLLDGFWGISPEYDGSIFGGSEEYTFEQQIEEATNYLSRKPLKNVVDAWKLIIGTH